MKKALAVLSIIALTGCMKKLGPDETMVMQGSELRLPPEYTLKAPGKVNTIKKEKPSVQQQSQKLLLDGSINNNDEDVNSWLLKNAGGNKRVKNIKEVLADDIAREENED
tara:strand:+ start:835 stop:1164 length:330 start_codon:yes stop_codon:yes gene_type:complete